jgi:hypothetical protein
MSEAIWMTGNLPHAMLQALEDASISNRKRWLTATAILRRFEPFADFDVPQTILGCFETGEPEARLAELRELLRLDLLDLEEERQQTLRQQARELQDSWAASNGEGVNYPAEVVHAAAALLDREEQQAHEAASELGLRALEHAIDLAPLTVLAEETLAAVTMAGRCAVFAAVAQTWREHADQIAEQTANQPRQRKILISKAVEFIQRGRQFLDGKHARKGREIEAAEHAAVAAILRDIFGNPFRPTEVDPRWLTSSVVDLARAIDAEQAGERMPILADALMDAGCDSDAIIAHCRNDGPHVRGCWVVGLILAKDL